MDRIRGFRESADEDLWYLSDNTGDNTDHWQEGSGDYTRRILHRASRNRHHRHLVIGYRLA